jgi:HTH-type transcriptional regulator/antitoxin HigA
MPNNSRLARCEGRTREVNPLPNAPNRDDNIEVLTTLIEQFEEKHFPVDISGPIAAIKYRMEEKGFTPRDLEPYIGSRARVSEVLSGKRQLSIDMIRSLHEGLDIPYEALLSERRQGTDGISAPVIARLNALGFAIDHSEVPAFISSSMPKSGPLALLRKTRTQRAAVKTDQSALLLWQAAVVQKSEKTQSAFSQRVFGAEALRKIGRMSVKSDGPVGAVRKLNELGVSVVVMPPLPGTFLDGAVMPHPNGHPIIGLTLRHDRRTDSFWYTLLHECAHVSLHFSTLMKGEVVFIDDMEIRSEDKYEREADSLARESLIPSNILDQVNWGPNTTFEDLIALATRARVHPLYCGRPLAARPPELQKVFTAYRKKLYSAVISGRVTTTVGSCAIGIAQHGDAGPTSSLWVCVLMVLSIRAIFSSSTTSIERFSGSFCSFASLNSSNARISSACVTTASDGMPALVSSPVSSSS